MLDGPTANIAYSRQGLIPQLQGNTVRAARNLHLLSQQEPELYLTFGENTALVLFHYAACPSLLCLHFAPKLSSHISAPPRIERATL